ncbi:hypothetical protein [Thalassospira sp. TSL5-1]|uniref:hypothetical protein n=1 Tax=Thalassospira sp. TSL5-1 TaxID=1544451 RepID=UPI00093AFA5A|nr:hypothetical protein [Thalassospira sp. TSL5-1]OKH89213.1 hypothetical protein LF95_04055 [Thalassospira sp. TSL5-1]
MPDSTREKALNALLALLETIDGVRAERNEPETETIPSGGLVSLRDGDPGEPEMLLSPLTYEWQHVAEIMVQKQHVDARTRDRDMDVILQAIDIAIDADCTLGGAVDLARLGAPEIITEAVEGAATIKAIRLPVLLEYTTTTPLG